MVGVGGTISTSSVGFTSGLWIHSTLATMAAQVKIWTMQTDFAILAFYNKVKVFEEEHMLCLGCVWRRK